MTFNHRIVLCLSLAACGGKTAAPVAEPVAPSAPAPVASEPAPASPPPPAAKPAYTLDESKLPPVNAFTPGDLDPARKACTDFGAHVNARWLAANPIPGDRTTWGSFEMLIERSVAIQRQIAEQAAAKPDAAGLDKIVGDLYATGMDEARVNAQGLEPLRGRLDAIDALSDRAALAEHLRQTAARGESFLFDLGPEADFDNPKMMMAYVAQGGIGLPDKTYYFDKDKKAKLAAYQKHIAKVLELAGAPAATAAKQAKDVVAFETRLARASKSAEEFSRDVSLFYHPVTLAEADKLTPAFPWSKLFAAAGVAPPEKFSLSVPAFHQEVNALLTKAPLAQWKSYLRFHTIDAFSDYLSAPFVQENFAFYDKELRGQSEPKARWKQVLDTVNGQAGEAMGQLYVEVAFSPQAKARMAQLVENLRAALKIRLEKLTWMSPETKKRAMDKWAAFTPKIGFPDKWRSWDGLATSRDAYLTNVLAAVEFNFKWQMGKVGKALDPKEWTGMQPQTVNAGYNPLRNAITFPAAILQPPFFSPDADDPLNYGGIGAVIGHEMLHAYDDQGSRFGPTGVFENWWTPADAKGFAALTGKLVAQFDAYEALPGRKVNGNLTLGENIADLGGLAVAYDAMKIAAADKPDPKLDGMTRDQRFYYNFATVWRRSHTEQEMIVRLATDPHAPAAFRAIGAPSNMASFAQAFDCKPGDPMVRSGADQLIIW